ncbi:MAG: GGDEF domain-containing protein [Alphaproteobacteria bacterium]|nr:GGDEF domain-containing protein [Alphaproteobacteria bacterium]
MTKKRRRAGLRLTEGGLDLLMPLHLWIGLTGHIERAGPTMQKLCPDLQLVGSRLTEVLEFRRPRGVQIVDDLRAADGQAAHVIFRAQPRNSLKGIVIALPGDQGVLLNLSLGISVAECVGRFGLKSKDFAPSDTTVEMLYLIEAQSAVLQESKNLNSRLQGAKIAAEEQAFTDTLTGLKNRRALDHVLAREITRAPRNRFGLMHIDLDFFKSVNDTHGHAAGDHVLQQAARIFVEETRTDDIVARTGGDEFVLILMGCDNEKILTRIAGRIIKRLQAPILFDGAQCRVSASIGITVSSRYKKLNAGQMASDADAALYQSKHRGRSCFTMFAPP